MKRKIVLSLMVTLYVSTPEARVTQEQCSSLDIRDQMEPEMRAHFSTPRNQGSVGWCYGFVAADLLSVDLGVPISSTFVSATYNQGVRRNPITRAIMSVIRPQEGQTGSNVGEGGFIRQAILQNMRQDFICQEDGLPFDSNNESGTLSHIRFLEDLEIFLEDRRGGEVNLNDCAAFAYQREINPFIGENLQLLANQLTNHHIDEYLANLVHNACPASQRVPVVEKRVLKRRAPSQGNARAVDNWFNDLGNVLERGGAVGFEYDSGPILLKNGGIAPHASVITGRRWSEGKCQFKVRNSWGEDCSVYDPSVIESCNEGEGSFWLSDDELLEISTNISFIHHEE